MQHHCICIVTKNFQESDFIAFMEIKAIHIWMQNHRNYWKYSESKVFVCCWFMCDYTVECGRSVAIHGPEPLTGGRAEVCCRPQRHMKEYRLFVIESVTTECTRQRMRNWKKCFGGWNVMWTVGFNHWTPQGCYWLPSMLLKAKGSFGLGFAVIRPDGVSEHNFQRTQERGGICESKSKRLTARKSCSV